MGRRGLRSDGVGEAQKHSGSTKAFDGWGREASLGVLPALPGDHVVSDMLSLDSDLGWLGMTT
jgi:hypothetical protein